MKAGALPGGGGGAGLVGRAGELAGPLGAIVEAACAAEPELTACGVKSPAAPVRRSRDLGFGSGLHECGGVDAEALDDLCHFAQELGAALRGARLVASPGREAAFPAARVEVSVAFSVGAFDDEAFEADLAVAVVVVEDDGGAAAGGELGALAALVVGEERDASGGDVDAAAEDDAAGRLGARADGGERDRVRVWYVLGGLGLIEPRFQEREGIWREWGWEFGRGREGIHKGLGQAGDVVLHAGWYEGSGADRFDRQSTPAARGGDIV